jgi:nucleoside-diphosphate-sugar epimerase
MQPIFLSPVRLVNCSLFLNTIVHISNIGYIGGTVLSRFLAHPKASSFVINALVRSPEKAGKLKAFGVTPVVGSLSDLQIIEKFASEADVVLSVVRAASVNTSYGSQCVIRLMQITYPLLRPFSRGSRVAIPRLGS